MLMCAQRAAQVTSYQQPQSGGDSWEGLWGVRVDKEHLIPLIRNGLHPLECMLSNVTFGEHCQLFLSMLIISSLDLSM